MSSPKVRVSLPRLLQFVRGRSPRAITTLKFGPWSLKLGVSLEFGIWNLEFPFLTSQTETSSQLPRIARAAVVDRGYVLPRYPKRAVFSRQQHRCSPETESYHFSAIPSSNRFQNR